MVSRRTLDSLPTELRTTIARKCFQADHNYKEMITNLVGCSNLHPTALQLIKDNENVYGHSISSLSLVSRSWREIAAPWIFKKLHVAKILEPIFILGIGRVRSDLFIEADIGKDYKYLPMYHQNTILSQLSSSPRLTSLSIASENSISLSPLVDSADYLRKAQRSVLVEAFGRVRHITFRVAEDQDWPGPRLVGMFIKIQRITIEAVGDNSGSDVGLPILRKGMALVPTLRDLELRTTEGIDLSPLYSADTTPSTQLPPPPDLLSLSIASVNLHPSILDYAQVLSATLQHLKVECTTEVRNRKSTLRFQNHHCFGKLISMTLLGPRLTVQPIWLSVSPSHCPALESVHLAFDYFHVNVPEAITIDAALKASQAVQFPHLKRYELADRRWRIDADVRECIEDDWEHPNVMMQSGWNRSKCCQRCIGIPGQASAAG
ncbi:hypothetical protein JCM5353_003325, partial [Sporobolomyces roseus]